MRNKNLDFLFSILVLGLALVWFLFVILIPESEGIKHFYSLGFILCLSAVVRQRRQVLDGIKFDQVGLSLGLFLTIFYILIRWYLWGSVDIWIDEHSQFFAGMDEKRSLITMAFKDQQPPMDYILSTMWRSILPSSLLTLKINSLVWGGMLTAALFLYFRSKEIERKNSFALAAVSLFLTPLVQQSFQSRPLCLSLVFCFFTLHYFFEYLDHRSRDSLISFFVAAFIFSITTGLQPTLMTLCLAFFVLLYIGPKQFFKQKFFFFFFLVGFLSLPTIYLLAFSTKASNQFGNGFEHVKFFLTGGYLRHLIEYYYELFPALLVGLICIFKNLKRGVIVTSKSFFITLFYSFITPFIYCLFISYHFHGRYILCVIIPFFFFLGELHKELIQHKLGKYLLPLYLILLSINFFFQDRHRIFPAYSSPGWVRMWSFLESNSEETDLLMALNLREVGVWRASQLVGQPIYEQNIPLKILGGSRYAKRSLGGDRIYLDSEFDYTSAQKKHIYIVLNKARSDGDLLPAIFSKNLVKEFSDLLIFRFDIGRNRTVAESLEEILSSIVIEGRPSPKNSSVYETLIILRARFGTKESAQRLLQEYREAMGPTKVNFRTQDGLLLNQKAILETNLNLLDKFIEEVPNKI